MDTLPARQASLPRMVKASIKTAQVANTTASSSKRPEGSGSKTSKIKSKSTPAKSYSSFNPIPITIPSPLPIPSSSKKPLTSSTHYVYVRPHQSTDDERPADRTVFATNLPVDIGERELRAVFGTWGVVESIEIGREVGGDVLEKAVRGSLENEETDDEEEDEEEEEGEEETRAEPTFLNAKNGLSKAQRRRLKRNKGLPPSIPSVVPLPSTNPRSQPYGPSGQHIAYITFLDPVSITKIMSYTGRPIPLPTASSSKKSGAEPTNPTGLEYYTRLHATLRPAGEAVKQFADSSMERYDRLQSLLLTSRAKQKGAGALVDEDGFTVVVRGGRYGRTGGRGDQGTGSLGVGVAKRGMGPKELKGGAAELTDFYKFQKVDRKRKELADLRIKFDHDKAKVEELKKSKRFKPY